MSVMNGLFRNGVAGGVCLALCWFQATWGFCGQEPAGAAARQYAAAVRLQNLESYDLAAEAWAAFVKDFPNDARAGHAMYYLGVCLYQQGEYAAARDALSRLIKERPKFESLDSAYLYLGVSQFNLASREQPAGYREAEATLKTLADKYPNGAHRPDALFYQGECAYMLGEKDRAEKIYQQTVAAYPDHKLMPDILYALGVTQEELDKPEEAGKTYDQFLHKHRGHSLAGEVFLRRGNTLAAVGRWNDAAGYFAEAAATGFAMADLAAFRRAEALARMEQFARAADLYASIATDFPQSKHASAAMVAAGKNYCLAGNHARTGEVLAGVLQAGGAAAVEAAHWASRSLLALGQPGEAFQVAEAGLAAAGSSPFAAALMMDQADALYEQPSRRGESVDRYAQIAAKHPEDAVAPEALYMAGFAALEVGRYELARDQTAKFLAAYQEHGLAPDVTYVAAEARLQLGEASESERLYRRLLEQHANHPDQQLWRVRCAAALQMQKKHAEAIEFIAPILGEIRDKNLLAEAETMAGQSALAAGQSDAAIKHLEASLAAAPAWRGADQSLLLLAEAERGQGNDEKAAAALERLFAESPKSSLLDKAHYRFGEIKFAKGDYAAAEQEFRWVLEHAEGSPLVPHALHQLACAQLNDKRPAEAEATASQLLSRFADHPSGAEARYFRGLARQQMAKYAPAAEDLTAAVGGQLPAALRPDALYVLGLCQIGLEQNAEAAKTLAGLLSESPDYAGADNARYQLAWALLLAERRKEAIEQFARLAKDSPESPLAAEAQHHIGEYFYDRKEYDKAAVAYYEAMQAAGQTPLAEKAAHKLGWSYYHNQAYASAEEAFAYQAAAFPSGSLKADGLLMVAESLYQQKKYAEALAAYGRVDGLTNEDFRAIWLLHAGESAGQLKRWEESLAWLKRAAEECPGSRYLPQALCEQGWARQNLGQYDEAIGLYEQVIAKTGSETAAKAQYMIGEIQFERKEHAEAVKSFFKVAYGYSVERWQAEATYEAGRCFEVLGKRTQAVKMYQELVAKYPQAETAKAAKERLAELKR
jgi:TolA-binding protein